MKSNEPKQKVIAMTTPYPENSNNSDLNNSNTPQHAYSSYPVSDPYPVDSASAGYVVDKPSKNKLALIGLILALVSVALTLTAVGIVLAIPLVLVALVLSIMGLLRAKKFAPSGRRRGLAITGVVISVLLSLFFTLLVSVSFKMWKDPDVRPCFDLSGEAQTQCFSDSLNIKLGK